MYRSLKTWVFCAIGALTVLACVPKEAQLDIPTAPDMSAVLTDYDAPSAPLNPESIESIITAYQDWEEYRGLVCGTGTCSSGLFCALCPGMSDLDGLWEAALGGGTTGDENQGSEIERFDSRSGALQVGGTEFGGDGYIRASRPCDGAPGAMMHLTVLISEEGLHSTVWGDIIGCDFDMGGVPARLDVQFRVSLGGEVAAKSVLPEELELLSTFVIWLNGDLESDGKTYGLTLDIKADTGKSEIQMRIPVETEHVLFYVRDKFNYGFDALNGRWSCDFPTGFPEIITPQTELECTQSDTGDTVSFSF